MARRRRGEASERAHKLNTQSDALWEIEEREIMGKGRGRKEVGRKKFGKWGGKREEEEKRKKRG